MRAHQSKFAPAIRSVLAAYRSTKAQITHEQITAAWTEFDVLRRSTEGIERGREEYRRVNLRAFEHRAEIERLRSAIQEHRDALDARALGDPDQVARDRGDIDNALYNETIPDAA